MMNNKKTIFLFLSILTFAQFSFAQPNRGVGVRVKNEAGQTQEIRLYDGSYALIIGASGYNNGWQKLNGVKEDVTAVSKVLTKHGFTVETAIDPNSGNLLATINSFVNKYGFVENNRLLIYFAGHGYTETGGDGRKFGYIVPVDAPDPKRNQIGFQQKAVTMDEIETVARRIRSKHALFVFDSCFSGSLVSRSKTIVPPIINYLSTQSVRQFITAGADNQEVPDESVFRQMFVRGLEGEADANKDGYITGTELAVYLQEQVIYYRGELQTPQYGKIRDPKLDRGDFVFLIPPPASADNSTAANGSTNQPNNSPANSDCIGGTTSLQILSKPKNKYTDTAKTNQVQGTVELRVEFLATGQIGKVEPIKGLPDGLTEQAVAAAKQIKFNPQKKCGIPETITKLVSYSFTLY
jgi:hypothetical protein